MQLTIDGTNVDNGTFRVLTGSFVDATDMAGVRTVVFEGIVEGDTVDEMQTRAAAMRAAFDTRQRTITWKADAAATNNFGSMAPGDGIHLDTVSVVSQHPSFQATSLSWPFVIACVATTRSSGQPFTDAGLLALSGLDSITVSDSYSADGFLERIVAGSFVDDGSDAKTLFDAARATILTDVLKVAADGSRDATTGLSLTAQSVDDTGGEKRSISFAFAASEQQDLPSLTAARAVTIDVAISAPDEWNTLGGASPTYIEASGVITVDKAALSGSITAAWATVRPDVLAIITAQTGKSSLKALKERYAGSPRASTLTFEAIYQADNLDTLSYSVVKSSSLKANFVIHEDSDADLINERVQTPARSVAEAFVLTVHRRGLGAIIAQDIVLPSDTQGMTVVDLEEATPGFAETEFGTVIDQTFTLSLHRFSPPLRTWELIFG